MSEHRFPMRKIEWDTVIGEKEDGSDRLADSLPVWAYDQLQAAPEMLELLRRAGGYGFGGLAEDVHAFLRKMNVSVLLS